MASWSSLLEGHPARRGRLHIELLEGRTVREQPRQAVRRGGLRQFVQTRRAQRLLDFGFPSGGGRTSLRRIR